MKLQVLVTVWLLVRIFQRIAWWMKMPLAKIEELSALALLHNPGAAFRYSKFYELPDITSVAVFDTAFHTSMPEWPTVIQCLIVTIDYQVRGAPRMKLCTKNEPRLAAA